MSLIARLTWMCLVFLPCIGFDQASKQAALFILPETGALSFLGGSLRVRLVLNEGAFLGLGSSLPEPWRHALLLFGVGGLLAGLLVFALFRRSIRLGALTTLTLFIAGGSGKLIDRLLHGGRVVDFLQVGIGPVHTGFFNVADLAITAGALVWMVSLAAGSGRGSSRDFLSTAGRAEGP